jgi:hypothetical protein
VAREPATTAAASPAAIGMIASRTEPLPRGLASVTTSPGAYRSSQLPSALRIAAVGSWTVRSLVRTTRTSGSSPQRTAM